MKKIGVVLLLSSLMIGCKMNNKRELVEVAQVTSEIVFEVKTTDIEDLEIFEDGIIPWISIENPDEEIQNLVGKDEIVIKENRAVLRIDYPLNKPVKISIESIDPAGFSRAELIKKISQVYHRIYLEEEETAKTKTVPLEERTGLINRNQTDGKYGIWGHDLGDLDLSVIEVRKSNSGELELELFVES